jgi:hypothetical protein
LRATREPDAGRDEQDSEDEDREDDEEVRHEGLILPARPEDPVGPTFQPDEPVSPSSSAG